MTPSMVSWPEKYSSPPASEPGFSSVTFSPHVGHWTSPADGAEITTVEGLIQNGQLHPIQQGFKEEHGLQCGFCAPGMMLVTKALLAENANPSEEEIRWAISGNICRSTGYQNIVKAVRSAAAREVSIELILA